MINRKINRQKKRKRKYTNVSIYKRNICAYIKYEIIYYKLLDYLARSLDTRPICKKIIFIYQQEKIENEVLKDTIYNNTKNAKFLGINLTKGEHEICTKSYKMLREIEEPLNT